MCSLSKFHQYVYGVTVNVQSDHKPLENILRKPLGTAPSRLQRMLLQLQRYDLNVFYKPGKELLIADTLSRAVIQEQDMIEDDVADEKVIYTLEPTEALSTASLEKLKRETQKDETLQLLKNRHRQGWPHHKKQVDLRMTQFWPVSTLCQ